MRTIPDERGGEMGCGAASTITRPPAIPDLSHVMLSLNGARKNLYLNKDVVCADVDDARIFSHFQPIFSTVSKDVFAHEGLIRAVDGTGARLPVPDIFSLPTSIADAVGFDRLCRALHLINFGIQGKAAGKLFLNLDGRFIERIARQSVGTMFNTLLTLMNRAPSTIVLEVIESNVDDLGPLHEVLAIYRRLGFGIAIDDFGAKSSNFDRLWRLTPDVVKIDRLFLDYAISDRRFRKILSKIVDIIHEMDALVVLEGVETGDQHLLAVDCGSDLVQGFLYARPDKALHAGSYAL